MSSTGFLYRRLASVVTCVFPHVGEGTLSLQNKYDIASLRDVFLSAHYWRVFEHLPIAPRRIVDLGAHCGHFSVLCHLALLERFGVDSAEYLLVEALPRLIPQIQRVVQDCGFSAQVKIVQGLVGKKDGTARFQTDPRNLLASQAVPHANGNGLPVLSYLDLDSVLPPGTPIDILKIDIEGSEYDLIENYPHLLRSAHLLLLELHGPTEIQLRFEQKLAALGFAPLSPTIVKASERLLCYGHRSRLA